MKNKIAEVDIAKPIVLFLQEAGWEVYQEVLINGNTADIIARNEKLLWAIETKTSLSMEVIGQAYNWRSRCHFCSIGVPYGKHNEFSRTILKTFGIGCIVVTEYDKCVSIKMDSPFYRKVDCNYIYKSLKEEQKTFGEAGTNSRKCWTPFQSTVRSITETVTSNNGIEFKDLIKKISHHYSSYSAAKNSLKKWIECGVIKGVVLKEDGGLLKCYLDNSNRDL